MHDLVSLIAAKKTTDFKLSLLFNRNEKLKLQNLVTSLRSQIFQSKVPIFALTNFVLKLIEFHGRILLTCTNICDPSEAAKQHRLIILTHCGLFTLHGFRDHDQHLLTHWGWVMHICVSDPTIIGSDNGLSPGRRQTTIWTNAGILLIRTLRINFSEIVSEIYTFPFTKMHLKMSSGKWRPFCLSLNVLWKWLILLIHQYLWSFRGSEKYKLMISTHSGLVTLYGFTDLDQHWFSKKLAAWQHKAITSNQYWLITNWTLRKTFQWQFNQIVDFSTKGNACENAVWKMVAIFFRLQHVDSQDRQHCCIFSIMSENNLGPILLT